ncbi:hypothetical protein [Dyadobacter sp. CY312]|uniref:hypothetical protein n=1 Tax=Dyadobacter sp. CY312 TaxID=2907303 RepID=UPI001F332A19|nr:hypothetical protein [Dyadobacter sp. CY312]MCE7042441.1 hypothetical protein [Dyadobacter sp. CY312]
MSKFKVFRISIQLAFRCSILTKEGNLKASSSLTFFLDKKSNRSGGRKKIKAKKSFHAVATAHPAFLPGLRTLRA